MEAILYFLANIFIYKTSLFGVLQYTSMLFYQKHYCFTFIL
jgi:hypothetical protein